MSIKCQCMMDPEPCFAHIPPDSQHRVSATKEQLHHFRGPDQHCCLQGKRKQQSASSRYAQGRSRILQQLEQLTQDSAQHVPLAPTSCFLPAPSMPYDKGGWSKSDPCRSYHDHQHRLPVDRCPPGIANSCKSDCPTAATVPYDERCMHSFIHSLIN